MELINTEHFKSSELTSSSTAKKLFIDNTPKEAATITNLNWLITQLELIRKDFGLPITVTSGYRCELVNNAVGGSKTSLHMLGLAADLLCNDNKKLFDLIKARYDFDQLIDEKNLQWVHVSFKLDNLGNRHLVLKL